MFAILGIPDKHIPVCTGAVWHSMHNRQIPLPSSDRYPMYTVQYGTYVALYGPPSSWDRSITVQYVRPGKGSPLHGLISVLNANEGCLSMA